MLKETFLTVLCLSAPLSVFSDSQDSSYLPVQQTAYSQPVLFNSSNPYIHRFNANINYGTSIEFTDGSNWALPEEDKHIVFSWKKNAPLVVTLNQTWPTEYKYCITNQETGEYVHANPFLPPYSFGPLSHWIVGFDKNAGHLFLENGTCWKVAYEDREKFKDWQINQTLIFVYNDSWFTFHPTIFINVEKNEIAYFRKL